MTLLWIWIGVIILGKYPYLWLIVSLRYRDWQSPINRPTQIPGLTERMRPVAVLEPHPEPEPPEPFVVPATHSEPKKAKKSKRGKRGVK